ncbi:MAG: DUF6320 domain-containing protein [Agathobacter sp.]
MSKCKNCGVEILDPTDKCPFCHWVLDPDHSQKEAMYPDARIIFRKFHFLENLVLFLSIVTIAIVIGINFWINPDFLWSFVVALALIYVNVILRFAILGKSGYQLKTISLLIVAVVLLVGIDYLTGYHGWALNFVFPSAILLLDLGIVILMIVNRRNWQSYMMIQILSVLLSLIPVILFFTGIISFAPLVFIALAASAFLFLGTLILGDQRARNELKRRFYI